MYKNSQDYPFTKILEDNWLTIRQELEQLSDRSFVEWPEKHLYKDGWDAVSGYYWSKIINLLAESLSN